jgi:exonuclease SbcD
MKIAAFADCHIGSYGRKIDERSGLNARFVDLVRSFQFVLQEARMRGVDEMLFAGDMYRGAKPTPTELFAVIENYGEPEMTMIPGNHDLPRSAGEESPGRLLRQMTGWGWHFRPCVVMGGSGPYQLAVLPYPNKAWLAASMPDYADLSPQEADRMVGAHIEGILRGLAAELQPGLPSVLLAHISLDCAELGSEQGIMAGRDITIPLHAIPEEFDFAVLGHIHKPQSFEAQGRPNVFYCGSTERIDFGEEDQQPSYVLLDLESKTWERVPIPCRKYCTFRVTLDGGSMPDSWNRSLSDAKDAICRIVIKRPEQVKPDYSGMQGYIEAAGCFDFRGFVEEIERVSAVRSEEIVGAETLSDHLRVWRESKGLDVPLDDLILKADELERKVTC